MEGGGRHLGKLFHEVLLLNNFKFQHTNQVCELHVCMSIITTIAGASTCICSFSVQSVVCGYTGSSNSTGSAISRDEIDTKTDFQTDHLQLKEQHQPYI